MGDMDTPYELDPSNPNHYRNWTVEQWVRFWEDLVGCHEDHVISVPKYGIADINFQYWLKMNMGFEYNRMEEEE